jgi:hypothetical protein
MPSSAGAGSTSRSRFWTRVAFSPPLTAVSDHPAVVELERAEVARGVREEFGVRRLQTGWVADMLSLSPGGIRGQRKAAEGCGGLTAVDPAQRPDMPGLGYLASGSGRI